MTFGDYLALELTEISFGHPQKAIGQEAEHLAAMAPSYGTPLKAVRDAKSAGGSFPVIIYAPSFSQVPWENADLCEYLASFGYTVLAVPAMGIGPESTHDVAGTNEQARDISFLLDYAKSLPEADLSEVAVVGYSWGGLANLFAASRDNRIRALVAMDGSMRYFPGIVKDAGDVHPDKMAIPLLYFKAQHSLEDQDELEAKFHDPGPNVLNEWGPGDLIAVSMLGLVHPEFSSRAQRNEDIWKNEMANLQEADYGREDGMIGYRWMARYTREFLDSYLKHDAAATQFLKRKPSENGVPSHVMDVTFKGLRAAASAQQVQPASARPDDAYLIWDKVLIPVRDGGVVSAVVVKKKGTADRLPTVLTVDIYTDPPAQLARAEEAADHGYVGVIADTRGKRLSPDPIVPYEHEASDGYDIIDWIAKQPWSDGQVGMRGGSYQGYTAWAAAKKLHPALKTIAVSAAAIPGDGLPMANNIFLNANYSWAFYVTDNKLLDDTVNNDSARWQRMQDKWFASGEPYRKIDQIDGQPNPLLQRWLQHPAYDKFWQDMVPYKQDFAQINIPVLTITGYYDDAQQSRWTLHENTVGTMPERKIM